ncbi:MAG TPA: SGNH/GDSL hydrolase family protein [Microbacterium sp.]|nr:SGNH/GDSL hydrolase family protein [Microbacterium sp.]
MTSPESRAGARRAWPLAAVAVAIALVCAFAAWRPWAPVVEVAGGEGVPVVAAPAALALPDQPRTLILGDSWTYGSAASAPELGYAYVLGHNLGWDTIVNGVRGSGYLKPGLDGGTFGERIAALDPALDPDLVIVQGSINDRAQGAEGYREAVNAAWDALAGLYPDAQIVVVGPAPQVIPAQAATQRIDRDLGELAAARGWWYVSPIAEEWITEANYASVIDTGIGRNHPSTAGHAYLASRLAEAIDGMTQSADIAAEVDQGE